MTRFLQAKSLINSTWGKVAALIILFSFIALPRILPFPPLYIATDEMTISLWVGQMTRALLAGDWEHTANNAYPAMTLAWVEAAQVGASRLFSGDPLVLSDDYADLFAMLPRRRFGLALLNSLCVLAAFWLLRQLYSNFVAITATILIAFDPFLLTQSRLFRTEGLTSSLMLLSILTVLLYAKGRQGRWLGISAVLAAWAVLTKITSIYLLPYTALTLFLWSFIVGRRKSLPALKLAARDTALWSLVMGAVFFAFWPALWVTPLTTFNMIYHYIQNVSTESSEVWNDVLFFQGEIVKGDPGISFYLLSLVYRITPVVGLGLIVALGNSVVLLWTQLRRRGSSSSAVFSTHWPVTILLLAYVFLYFIGMSIGAAKVDRYLIPIFPALAILAAVGFQIIVNFITGPSLLPDLKQEGVWAVILVGSAWLSLPHHPYYFTYWNPILGGGRVAAKILPVSGLEGTDTLLDILNHQSNASELKLSGPSVRYCYLVFTGKCLGLADFLASDYFITDISSLQRVVYLSNLETDVPSDELANTDIRTLIPNIELVQKYTKDGLDYAWLYRMPSGLHSVRQSLGTPGIFTGYRLPATSIGAGDVLEVSIFWQNGEQGWQFDDSEFFVKLVDETGQVYLVTPAPVRHDLEPHLYRAHKHLVFSAPLTLPAATPLRRYTLDIGLRLKATGVETWHFPLADSAKTITVNRGAIAAVAEDLPIEHRLNRPLPGTGLTLLGYDTISQEPSSRLYFYWQVDHAPAHDYSLKLTVSDSQQQNAVTWHNLLAPTFHPTTLWQAGEVVKTSFPLELGQQLVLTATRLALTVSSVNDPITPSTLIEFDLAENFVLKAPTLTIPYQLTGVTFDQGLDLLGYELHGQGQEDEQGKLYVTLHWLNRQPLSPVEAKVEVLNEYGEIIAEQIALVSPSDGFVTWRSVNYYEIRLTALPTAITVQTLPVGAASDRIVITDITSKMRYVSTP